MLTGNRDGRLAQGLAMAWHMGRAAGAPPEELRAVAGALLGAVRGLSVRLAVRWARRDPRLDLEELVQVGQVAWLEALRRYRAGGTARFTSYGFHWARHRIAEAAGARGRGRAELSWRYFGDESAGPLDPIDPAPGPAEAADARDAAADAGRLVEALGRLRPRARLVIERRYGLDGEAPEALGAVGRRLGVSKARVEQIEKAALHALAWSLDPDRHARSFPADRGRALVDACRALVRRGIYPSLAELGRATGLRPHAVAEARAALTRRGEWPRVVRPRPEPVPESVRALVRSLGRRIGAGHPARIAREVRCRIGRGLAPDTVRRILAEAAVETGDDAA